MTETDLSLDLTASGRLPELPAAYLAGRDRDLLAPLSFTPPGELPGGEAPTVDRGSLAEALRTANRAYGHPAADELARRLADPGTRVVVTGQQPGLFGGPLYTLSKAVAAVRWAAALEEAGTPAVPVFWVATEDHDFAEVARTAVPTRQGPRHFDLGADPEPLAPVGTRTLGPRVVEVLAELAELRAGERYAEWWGEVGRWYRPDARFGEAFCRLLVRLLGERCPLLLDAMLPGVKAAQRPWLGLLVERRGRVEEALAAADAAIGERGYGLQVAPQPGLSPLFLLHRGERRRIEWTGEDTWGLRGAEEAGGPVAELAERIRDNPVVASPGVLARPAVQDAILGTSLQVLGPGELSYMAQAAAVYPVLDLPGPAVALRPQVLTAEDHQLDKVEQVGLSLDRLLGDETALEHEIAARTGSDPVTPVREAIARELESLNEAALGVDPNLERPWEKTRDAVLRSLEAFGDKVAKAAVQADAVTRRRIDRLRQDFLPGGRLQERVISSAHYPGKYGDAFVASLLEQLDLDPRQLQVVRLEGS